jgi:hypothetical protein
MSISPAVLLTGVVAATLLACHEAPTAPIIVGLQLDRDAYVAIPVATGDSYAFRLVVHYQNTTRAPIYFERCTPSHTSPLYAVPTADGATQSGYDPIWACTYAPALELLPAVTRTDTLTIFGPTARDGMSHQAIGVLSGHFRLEYATRQCGEDTPACAAAGPRVASGPFRVFLP